MILAEEPLGLPEMDFNFNFDEQGLAATPLPSTSPVPLQVPDSADYIRSMELDSLPSLSFGDILGSNWETDTCSTTQAAAVCTDLSFSELGAGPKQQDLSKLSGPKQLDVSKLFTKEKLRLEPPQWKLYRASIRGLTPEQDKWVQGRRRKELSCLYASKARLQRIEAKRECDSLNKQLEDENAGLVLENKSLRQQLEELQKNSSLA